MDFTTKCETVKSGRSIVYIEVSHHIISKINIVFRSLEIDFGKQTAQIMMNAAFHLNLYLFSGFKYTKGYRILVATCALSRINEPPHVISNNVAF